MKSLMIKGWVINKLGTDLLWNEIDSVWFSWGTVFETYKDAERIAKTTGVYVFIYPVFLENQYEKQ